MNREQLREVQGPIKKLYRENAEAAVVEMRSQGTAVIGQQQCEVSTASGKVVAGLHRAAGGDGSGLCSGDMLLDSLVACAGVTLSAVATSMGLNIANVKIEAIAKMDFRGTMGISPDVPVGIQHVELHFDIDSRENVEQLSKLVELTERYCVIFQTLQQTPIVETSWSVAGAEKPSSN